MAKEKEDPERKAQKEKKDKKDKKDKKEKPRRSATDGVSKEKRSKKERKGSKDADEGATTQDGVPDPITAVLDKVEAERPGTVVVVRQEVDGARKERDWDKNEDGDQAMMDIDVDGQGRVIKADGGKEKGDRDRDLVTEMVKGEAGRGALVPFANPLADEKAGRKVFKGVRKAAKNRTLKRGVKEVVKALRKSTNNPLKPSDAATTTTTTPLPHAIVVLAADISPMDVISHIPVLCEDHNVPYLFVPSRAELGAAGATKRPTSVVMVGRDRVGRRKGKEEEGKKEGTDGKGERKEKEDTEEEWMETYRELVKVADKLGRSVRI